VLAIENAAHGVRVNAVAPGDVETGILDEVRPDGRQFLVEHGKAAPIGRVAQPGEIAFLASDLHRRLRGPPVGRARATRPVVPVSQKSRRIRRTGAGARSGP
jgi:NAD(P)-dependent dehydrogenase (short-subunit alcohol dehydrogenase family)